MNRKAEVICLQCPLACRVEVEVDKDNKVVSASNYKCKRGKTYAAQEIINPVRVLTTTVRVLTRDQIHPLLPVTTREAIPKGLLQDAMKQLAGIEVKTPVKYGDVICPNILNTGVDVVATSEVLN